MIMNEILIKDKYDNILVFSCVFWAICNFAYNFMTFTGGGPGPIIVQFKLNYVLEAYITLLLLSYFIIRPTAFIRNSQNQRF